MRMYVANNNTINNAHALARVLNGADVMPMDGDGKNQ